MITKLNLLTTFGALVLFFLPWIDIQCNQRSMITQSGFQTITGDGSLSDDFKKLHEDQDHDKDQNKDKLDPAIFVAAAFLLVILAFGLALASAFGRRNRDRSVGILTAMALACILAQMALQFPAEKDINRSLKPGASDHDDPIARSIGSALTDIKVLYRNPLYFELALLALPTLLLLNTLIDKRRAQQSN